MNIHGQKQDGSEIGAVIKVQEFSVGVGPIHLHLVDVTVFNANMLPDGNVFFDPEFPLSFNTYNQN